MVTMENSGMAQPCQNKMNGHRVGRKRCQREGRTIQSTTWLLLMLVASSTAFSPSILSSSRNSHVPYDHVRLKDHDVVSRQSRFPWQISATAMDNRSEGESEKDSWFEGQPKLLYEADLTYQGNLEIRWLARTCAEFAAHPSTMKKAQEAAHQAHECLQRMERDALSNRQDATTGTTMNHFRTNNGAPDTVTYNMVLHAHAKAGHVQQVKDLFQTMERVSEQQHKALADHWNERNNNASRTTTSLDDDDDDDPSLDPNNTWHPPKITVQPTVRTYTTIMDAMARSRSASYAQAATDLLHKLVERSQQQQQEEPHTETHLKENVVQVNEAMYNACINAWAKSDSGAHGAQRATQILRDMLQTNVKPTVVTFNTVIHAWAKSGVVSGGKKAETIMHTMRQCGVEPNERTYTTLMDCWSKCASEIPGAAHRALELLTHMTKSTSLRPNCVAYSTVIDAFARSREPNKALMAVQILKRMRAISSSDPRATPSLVTYNSVFNACATSYYYRRSSNHTMKSDHKPNQSSDAKKIVLEADDPIMTMTIVKHLYQELSSGELGMLPDHMTYGTVLKACAANHLNDEDFVTRVFHDACEAGRVTFGVCFELRKAANAQLYQSLLPEEGLNVSTGHFDLTKFPPSWTCNVPRSTRPYNGNNGRPRANIT